MTAKSRPIKGSSHKSPSVRKREITDAAALCFGHAGYYATSIDQVAKKAGLSKGSVYRAFASKEELLLAILEHFEEDIDKIMLESAQFELSPLSKIKLTMKKIGIYLKDNEHLLRVWNEFMYLDFSRGQYGKMMEKNRAMVTGLVVEGVNEGEIRDLPVNAVVDILMSFLLGLFELSVTFDDFELSERLEKSWGALSIMLLNDQ